MAEGSIIYAAKRWHRLRKEWFGEGCLVGHNHDIDCKVACKSLSPFSVGIGVLL